MQRSFGKRKSNPCARIDSMPNGRPAKYQNIRNHESIRKNMYADHEIGVNEHLTWINDLRKKRIGCIRNI